jgi:aldose sugar dehydrogenase
MLKISTLGAVLFLNFSVLAQTFIRSELPTSLNSPWEIIYGPDGFLWLTEFGGKISRVDPVNGNKTIVYTALDYFNGDPSEKLATCFNPNIGAGTLGMALHPNFLNSSTSYIYFVHSYNSGTATTPVTKFKIRRLTWNAATNSVSGDITLVSLMPTGYDHLGGRLMIIEQNSIPYLFYTVGDNGISEINSPTCYSPQTNNPNNFVQDPIYKNGKIHRFSIDGSIPANNPLPGNSFYTRGHRNPQGLMYNSIQNVIYDIEHGDRTDDEINVLEAGMNYGWKNVRGYHNDNSFPGEASVVSSYTPYPGILNDALKEPLYSWCATSQPTTGSNGDWCTVAPSDGIYYGSSTISDWTNSLLVVTLKNGTTTDMEVYQFKLNADGKSLVPSTLSNLNPKRYFSEDQALNGRLRDITFSTDGKKIYLINNGGATADKITVYTYVEGSGLNSNSFNDYSLELYPNPVSKSFKIDCSESIQQIILYSSLGCQVSFLVNNQNEIDVSDISSGVYVCYIYTVSGRRTQRKIIIE